jgi:tRNA threonylcarbamoyladenosine biosynthesis protein TsaB
VLVLAIDTCDSRGSVALWRDGVNLEVARHEPGEEYSSWLLPAVDEALKKGDFKRADVEAYGVASGPGSFTGVRVGLTTVKAWGEVYRKPIVAVSRLEVMAAQASGGANYVAAFGNAQREQVFGAVYRRNGAGLEMVGEEMVIAPGKFVQTAAELAVGEGITWVSTDADCILKVEEWQAREKLNERIEMVSCYLAPMIADIAANRVAQGRFTDALALDANYVRRSDAEVFWKDGAARGR